VENDFRALLAGNTALIALVGARIYPSTYAQGATNPCIRYRKITGSTGLHMQGSDGLSEDLMQVDVRATTKASATAVRDAVKALLHGFAGLQGSTDFRVIEIRDDRGVIFETTGAEEFYSASVDFDVFSKQT